MRYKGRKERWVATSQGEVKIERGYFYCETCREGIFPLDERWELTGSVYSPTLARHMVWLSGMLPSYEAAAEVFERIAGRALPAVSLWRQTQQDGERLAGMSDTTRSRSVPNGWWCLGRMQTTPARQGSVWMGGWSTSGRKGGKRSRSGRGLR